MLLTPPPRNLAVAGMDPDRLRCVEGDVYGIAERIKAISPNLRIVLHQDHPEPWVVMEDCVDGQVRFVARYKELNAGILEDLRRMLAIPYEKRYAETLARLDRENAELRNAYFESEEFEELAWEFQKALDDANMGDSPTRPSYRPFRKIMRSRGNG